MCIVTIKPTINNQNMTTEKHTLLRDSHGKSAMNFQSQITHAIEKYLIHARIIHVISVYTIM